MATKESTRDPVADAATLPTLFKLAGTSITRTEETDCDVYQGAKEELIAAGIVCAEQWPPEGKKSVSWSHGQRVRRNCKKDEAYRKICLYGDLPKVSVGVPPSVRQVRKSAALARWWKERDDKQLKELVDLADRARRSLEEMPKTQREFLLDRVCNIREMVCGMCLGHLDKEVGWHGFRFTTEAKEAAFMAVDAIVEALMDGEVIFDSERHAQIVAKHQAVVRAADPFFERQFKALTAPNVSILEGEAS